MFYGFPTPLACKPSLGSRRGSGCSEGAFVPWGSGDTVGPGSWTWTESGSGSALWDNKLKHVDSPLLHGGEQEDAHPGAAAHSQQWDGVGFGLL